MSSPGEPSTRAAEDRERALGLLKRYGWNATSFQTLEPDFHHWFDGDSACVAYVDTGTAWVAAGAPVADEASLGKVAERFLLAARQAGRRGCFFGAEERFLEQSHFGASAMGEQPVWNPQHWAATVQESRNLREQLRRARAKGVQVRALEPSEVEVGAPLRRQLEALLERWLDTRPMPPMGFLVQLDIFSFLHERRCFVAQWQGEPVGLLVAIPIYGRQGWFFEDLVRDVGAPNGTLELLVDHAMRLVASEGSTFATLGLAPLAGAVGVLLRWARTWGRGFYDFRGLLAFKTKFRPQRWEPVYLAYPRGQSRTVMLWEALRAFAGGSLLGFAWRMLARGPALLPQLLAVLLVPWTLLLGSPWAARYFPSPGIQHAWLAFDAVLAVALFSLAQRWRGWLGRALPLVITGDALLTLYQALSFNFPRAQRFTDVAVGAVAVAAPALAAALLFRVERRDLEVRPVRGLQS